MNKKNMLFALAFVGFKIISAASAAPQTTASLASSLVIANNDVTVSVVQRTDGTFATKKDGVSGVFSSDRVTLLRNMVQGTNYVSLQPSFVPNSVSKDTFSEIDFEHIMNYLKEYPNGRFTVTYLQYAAIVDQTTGRMMSEGSQVGKKLINFEQWEVQQDQDLLNRLRLIGFVK